jgi:8-oxo-dGTP diphosphatase
MQLVYKQRHFILVEYNYGDKKVRLDVRLVELFQEQASHQEGQQSQWDDINDLGRFTFPDANKEIIDKLVSLVVGN